MNKALKDVVAGARAISADAQAKKVTRKPPQNPIIGRARADKWDEQLDSAQARTLDAALTLDGLRAHAVANHTNMLQLRERLRSANRWAILRDSIIIVMLLLILAMAAGNTSVIQHLVNYQ